jgi:hypothetical protein
MEKLILLLLICTTFALKNSTVQDACVACIDYGESVFSKVVWYPLYAPEYRCIDKRAFRKFNGFILDFTCEYDYCADIEYSETRFIWNNFTSNCEKLIDWNQIDISPQTYLLWLQVALLIIILSLVSIGKF